MGFNIGALGQDDRSLTATNLTIDSRKLRNCPHPILGCCGGVLESFCWVIPVGHYQSTVGKCCVNTMADSKERLHHRAVGSTPNIRDRYFFQLFRECAKNTGHFCKTLRKFSLKNMCILVCCDSRCALKTGCLTMFVLES